MSKHYEWWTHDTVINSDESGESPSLLEAQMTVKAKLAANPDAYGGVIVSEGQNEIENWQLEDADGAWRKDI